MHALKVLLHLSSFAVLLLSNAVAQAAMVDCRPPEAARFVVFLSEPQYSPTAFSKREDMLRFFNRLQEYLDQRRDSEMAGIKRIDFRVARCEKRVPAPDGHDFTNDVVRNLYDRGVVVEIWGTLDVKQQGGKPVSPTAQINYLLVPVKRGVVEGSDKVPGIHRFNYPDAEIVATDFVDLISNMDLHAFVATAIGVMAFDGEDFALAHEMLCKAGSQLSRTEKRLALKAETKSQSEGIQQLRVFLRDLAGKAIVEARQKPSAAVPAFARLLEPSNPCSEEPPK